MEQSYQSKYRELLKSNKKQEQTINKLQRQIRQRYQNYLIHASHHKSYTSNIANQKETNGVKDNQKQTKSHIIINQSSNRQNKFRTPRAFNQDDSLVQSYIINQSQDKQIHTNQKLENTERKVVIESSSGNQELHKSYKERIALIQKQKNEKAKQVQKYVQRVNNLEKKTKMQEQTIQKMKKQYKKVQKEKNKIEFEEAFNMIANNRLIHESNKLESEMKPQQKAQKIISFLENSSIKKEKQDITQSLIVTPNKFQVTPESKQLGNTINTVSCEQLEQERQRNTQLVTELDKWKNLFMKLKKQRESEQQDQRKKQTDRLTNQISKMKEELSNTKEKSEIVAQIKQPLQAPYYVEEELPFDSNNPYVKRSFIRKKIVKRNLSATTYRVVSKSKDQMKKIIESKINKSPKKPKKRDESPDLRRVSEVSRQSDIDRNSGVIEDEVRIVQLTTTTPREEIVTTKIYSKNKGQSGVQFRKNL